MQASLANCELWPCLDIILPSCRWLLTLSGLKSDVLAFLRVFFSSHRLPDTRNIQNAVDSVNKHNNQNRLIRYSESFSTCDRLINVCEIALGVLILYKFVVSLNYYQCHSFLVERPVEFNEQSTTEGIDYSLAL